MEVVDDLLKRIDFAEKFNPSHHMLVPIAQVKAIIECAKALEHMMSEMDALISYVPVSTQRALTALKMLKGV